MTSRDMTFKDILTKWEGRLGHGPTATVSNARATIALDAKKAGTIKKADSRILQQTSRIARTSELTEEITPTLVAEAITAASSGNIGKLQGLYLRMKAADARYSGHLRALKAGLLANPLRVHPSKTATPVSKEYAQIAEDLLGMFKHSSLVTKLTMPYITGVRVYEPLWVNTKGRDGKDRILPYELETVPPTLYRMDMAKDSSTYGELMIVTEDESDGVPISNFPWGRLLVITDGEEKGWYDQAGAARSCLFWFLVKTKNSAWWAELNEVYGEPHRIAYFDENITEDELTDLEQLVKKIGKAAYAIFPNGTEIDLIEAKLTGSIKTFSDLIDLANAEIAIAIVGQTQTSDGGQYGSFAKAKVHKDGLYDIIKLNALMLKEAFDELIITTIAFNVGPDLEKADLPVIKLVVPNPEEKEVKARVFKYAQEIGLEIPKKHVQDELGIPEPDDDDEILEPQHLQQNGDSELEEGRDLNDEDEKRQTDRDVSR